VPATSPRIHLWRIRRRGVHIDADLRRASRGWTLTFLRNDRPLVSFDCADEHAARAQARAMLRELQVAGWVEHW
jgi:hypothetical protein